MTRFTRYLLGLSLPLLLGVPACSKENNVDQSEKTTNNIRSGTVTGDGGLIGDRNSVGVFVPKFAVDGEVEIVLRDADASEYTAPNGGAGIAYAFEPFEAAFFTDVDIYIPRPDPSVTYSAQFSPDGVNWQPISGKIDNKAGVLHFKAISFGFFMAYDPLPNTNPDNGAGGGMPVGAGGGPSGGSTGSGGTTGASDMCMPDASAKAGFADVGGQVTAATGDAQNFATKDGLVATMDLGSVTEVALMFSDMPEACGTALASGSTPKSVGTDPAGRANSNALGVTFRIDGGGGLVSGTYQVMQVTFSSFGADCQPTPMPQGAQGTVTIMEVTADRVTGSLGMTDESNGQSLSGMFDVPLCPLAEAPAGRCCVQ